MFNVDDWQLHPPGSKGDSMMQKKGLTFDAQKIIARFVAPTGQSVERQIEIRKNPITDRTSRIASSRANERDVGNETLPEPPPDRHGTDSCPFCRPQVTSRTPRLDPILAPEGRLLEGASILFPNYYPYGCFSAVSLIDEDHFVEIGTASLSSYTNSFINCRNYLRRISKHEPQAIYMAITQNHLPSAGGSLLHPHLQINADTYPPNNHRYLKHRADRFYRDNGSCIFSSYLAYEKSYGRRYIGQTGNWEWLAAFAPEGFFEIWGILPEVTSLIQLRRDNWKHLSLGLLNIQRYYRHLGRNGYNLGLLSVEAPKSKLDLRIVVLARSNHAPWVRNDHTGYEVMLGDMTTFSAPEQIAVDARNFFGH
jgi:galactose-1-phosphate uridylyltransferase